MIEDFATGGGAGGSDTRPVPDPTVLTTEQLHREIGALREFVLGEIRHVSELTDEKFRAVYSRFESVDDKFEDVAHRTAEQKTDTKDALDAALQAAKDAVSLQTEASDKSIAKSEAATTKQIDALGTLVDKSSEAKDEKINDLKSRLDKLETAVTTQLQGAEKTSTNQWALAAIAVALIAVLVTVGLGLANLIQT